MKGTRSLLLRGATWVAAGGLIVNLFGIVSTIFLARLLVPADFGLVAIATAFAGIVGVLSEFSLAKALVQRTEVEEEHYHTAWTMNVIRGLVIGSLLALLGLPVASFYGDDRIAGILVVLGISVFVGSLANPKMAVFDRKLSFSQAFYLRVSGKIAAFVVTIAIAWIYQSYWALVLGAVASEVAVVIGSYIAHPFRPKLVLSKYRDLLSFSVWLTAGQWVQALNWRAQPLVYGYVLPQGLLGQYSLSNKVVSKTLEQATSPLKAVLFPAFSRLKDEPERLRGGYLRSLGVLCMLAFPVAAGFAVLAEEFVLLALGEKWLPAVPLMQILVILRIVQLSQNINAVAMATGNTKKLFDRDVRALLIRWPLIIAGLYLGRGDDYSMLIGAMIGGLMSAAINGLLNMRMIARITPITVRDHASILWKPTLAATLMAASVLLANAALPGAGNFGEIAIQVAALVALGGLVYPIVLYSLWILRGKQQGIETECAAIIQSAIQKVFSKGRALRGQEGS